MVSKFQYWVNCAFKALTKDAPDKEFVGHLRYLTMSSLCLVSFCFTLSECLQGGLN